MKVGIIGGSGLDNPEIFELQKEMNVTTPYGEPSSSLKTGLIEGKEVVLLGRHGREHTIPPAQVNYRANIYALKEAGCNNIIATTAVGSLRDEIKRGDLVIIDQFIDFTKQREMTFHTSFLPHTPVHIPMANPYNSEIRKHLIKNCEKLGYPFHKKGTVITIEGPRFSSKAESYMFRAWGADIINMSIATETILANEAGIPYAAVAMSTDYDCWKEDEEPVNWETIQKVFTQNAQRVIDLLIKTIPEL